MRDAHTDNTISGELEKNDGGNFMDPITWANFPLPLLQVNPPKIARTNEIVSHAYTEGIFSNSGPIQREVSEVLAKHVNREFSGYLASSNTSALIACLLEINVRGKHVLVSNFTFAATLHAIVLAGGIPVLCDVVSDDLVISINQVKEILESSRFDVAAVLPTRIFGFITDFSDLIVLCGKYEIPVLIDAAATIPDKPDVWNFKEKARFEVFSLHATKVFGIGEGGLIVGSRSSIESVSERSNFGIGTLDPEHFTDGLNAKADEFTAARALSRFPEYAADVAKRRKFVEGYKKVFENSAHVKVFREQFPAIYSYFPIVFDTENNLLKFVEIVNPYIRTRRYYFPSLNTGYIGEALIEKPHSLAISDSASRRILCLPVYISCTDEVRAKILELVTNAERLLS